MNLVTRQARRVFIEQLSRFHMSGFHTLAGDIQPFAEAHPARDADIRPIAEAHPARVRAGVPGWAFEFASLSEVFPMAELCR